MDEVNANEAVKRADKPEFVTVEITERQFITHKMVDDGNGNKVMSSEPLYESANGVKFGKIICPDNGAIWFPIKNMQAYDNKTKKTFDGQELRVLHFDFPKGTLFEVHFSNGIGNEDTIRQVAIEDLKQMFQQARVDYAKENSTFVNFQVPTSWDNTPDDKDFARISIPIDRDGDKKYFTFMVKRDSFKPSEYNEGMSYFGFPRVSPKDGEPWEVNLRHSEKTDQVDENGKDVYLNEDISLSSAELKAYVDEAIQASASRHLGDSHSFMDDLDFSAPVPKAEESENVSAAQTESASLAQGMEAPAAGEEEGFANRIHRGR